MRKHQTQDDNGRKHIYRSTKLSHCLSLRSVYGSDVDNFIRFVSSTSRRKRAHANRLHCKRDEYDV